MTICEKIGIFVDMKKGSSFCGKNVIFLIALMMFFTFVQCSFALEENKRIETIHTNHVNFESIAMGENHNLAVGLDGAVFAWGKNNYGQLGDGTEISCYSPNPVLGLKRWRRKSFFFKTVL